MADNTNGRILIIDDNPSIHEDFQKILQADDHKPAIAEVGGGRGIAHPAEVAHPLAPLLPRGLGGGDDHQQGDQVASESHVSRRISSRTR